MSKTIYNADYSECLPEALKKDPKNGCTGKRHGSSTAGHFRDN